MIKINLLPIKAARKREYVKQQLILGAVLLVGAIVGLFMWNSAMNGKIDDATKRGTELAQQIEQYTRAIGEVERFKGLEETLKQKLKIIDDLVRGKVGPVKVLDHLSQIIPEKVWLLKWDEKGGRVTVEGEALSLKEVGRFMTVLATPMEESAPTAAAPVPGVAPATAVAPAPAAGAVAAPAAPAPEAAPTKTQHRFFSNIQLVETKSVDDATYHQTFVQFKLTMNVSYSM
ncbi:MAG: hypothetical protein GYA21_17700 [Myxococcales bacterium]|nr:hypothetical protein [Myxococcales bacterium]